MSVVPKQLTYSLLVVVLDVGSIPDEVNLFVRFERKLGTSHWIYSRSPVKERVCTRSFIRRNLMSCVCVLCDMRVKGPRLGVEVELGNDHFE